MAPSAVLSNKLYAIDAEYPQFMDVSVSFNSKVSDFVNNNITEFKKASAENWKIRQDTTPAGESKQEFPDQSITFYFPKYQVAPGVFGEQNVPILIFQVK